MEKTIPNITLPGNIPMPILGLGTWNVKEPEVLHAALDGGYTLLDTAYSYKNHSVIGGVLAEKIRSGKLKREDVFITTKVPGIFMTSREQIRDCLQKSLSQLQVSYVDLCLIHGPCAYKYVDDETIFPKDDSGKPLYTDCDLAETWKAMECMVDEGLTRAIGVSNFNIKQLEQITNTARIPVANHQIECHAYLQQKAMRDFCASQGISVTAFAPLGNPKRAKRMDSIILLNDPVVVEMSAKYNKSPAQILLAFLMQERVAVIPTSKNQVHLAENMQAINVKLSEEDLDSLRKLDRGHRFFTFEEIFHGHPAYPFVD